MSNGCVGGGALHRVFKAASPLLTLAAVMASSTAGPAAAASADPAQAAPGPEEEAEAGALAMQLQNPVADLVSIPLQFNWAQPVGPEDATRFLLNIQPVMPFKLTERWNLIVRMILPVLGQPPLQPGGTAASGLGDTLLSFFLSPEASEPFIWGIGPYLILPSTAEPTLGSGKWSAGPTGVILKQTGPLTYGALVNQAWSFAGNEDRGDVSQLYLQPFLSFTTKSAVSVGVNSEMLANWKAPSGARWTIPINLVVSKVSMLGPFPASFGVGAGYYVESPPGGPDWQLRLLLTLLLPKKQK